MQRVTLIALALVTVPGVGWPQTAPAAADVLRQSMQYQFQFRAGQYDVAPKFVAMAEEATKAYPDNADIWNAMGTAHMSAAAGAMLTGGTPAEAGMALQKGLKALERAMELNPNHAEALAIHGGVLSSIGTMGKMPALAAKGVGEMNRAADLAPTSARVRLTRAFNGLILPDDLRSHATEEADLAFAIQLAKGSRAGNYVRIIRGDLEFELGKIENARSDYETVSKSASPAAEEAKARLAALDQGGVTLADIKKLRSQAGANCTMCHGK